MPKTIVKEKTPIANNELSIVPVEIVSVRMIIRKPNVATALKA
jgi:hypothetical protein